MQRAHRGTDAAAAATAAAATVAPLQQLKRAAEKADKLARFARAAELYKRALAAAELSQPRDSLIIAALLGVLSTAHTNAAQASPDSPHAVAERTDLYQRSFHLLHARWQASTLFAPTAEEVAYFLEDEYPFLPAQMCGAYFYITVTHYVAEKFPPRTPGEAEARLHAVYGALRAALEMDARGMLERHPRTHGASVVSIVSGGGFYGGFSSQSGGARPCDTCAVRRGWHVAPHARHVRPDG
jgi:hypothetical protein